MNNKQLMPTKFTIEESLIKTLQGLVSSKEPATLMDAASILSEHAAKCSQQAETYFQANAGEFGLTWSCDANAWMYWAGKAQGKAYRLAYGDPDRF